MSSTTTSGTNPETAQRGAQGAVDARARAVEPSASDPRAASQGANARVTAEVLTWPGVEAGTGRRGEWAFRLDRRELGHLHGDTTAHFGFPKDVWRELHAAGRIDYHPVFPGKEGPAARRIATEDDVRDVIAMLRLNYDRVSGSASTASSATLPASVRGVTATGPAGDFDYDTPANAGYAQQRQTDPRIAALVHDALGDARTVVNVGAGSGSYEPDDREVTAVEPSAAMRAQRPAHRAPAIAGSAGDLPFEDTTFDAAMAMVTVHQWPDAAAGVAELRRVARGPVVILTFDPAAMGRFWLSEYAPELLAREIPRFPTVDELCAPLGPQAAAQPVPVPIDCVDGFMEAFYARPEAFLDDRVRAAQSSWGFIDEPTTVQILDRLRADLESGRWDERHGALRAQPQFDGSLTLVVDPS